MSIRYTKIQQIPVKLEALAGFVLAGKVHRLILHVVGSFRVALNIYFVDKCWTEPYFNRYYVNEG